MTVQIRISFTWLLGSMLLFISCSTSRNGYRHAARHIQREITTSPVFNRAFTGFTLLDPETGRWLADVNGDHYFTPASNTKIFTLYTCLKVLGDSVPALQVQRKTLHEEEQRFVWLVRGTGDPTFLHPYFQKWQTSFDFLKALPGPFQLLPRQLLLDRFGPGWAWDDFAYGFQPERSLFPMYGNVVRFLPGDNYTFDIYPPYFRKDFIQTLLVDKVTRKEFDNLWFVPGVQTGLQDRFYPFTTVDKGALLSDTLQKTVEEVSAYAYEYIPPDQWKTVYSTPIDTVMRRMMYESDNFIAEQMLLVCAGEKFGRFDSDTMIQWMLDSTLHDLPQRPRWVDGSGLSRYNLMTPQSIATVLLHLWREQPHDELMRLFPAGGVQGTLSDWYGGKDGKPYVFAKTGSMSGVTCLSGYVRTRRGKTLIFSFMNNHFVGSSREWKQEMQRMLEMIQNW